MPALPYRFLGFWSLAGVLLFLGFVILATEVVDYRLCGTPTCDDVLFADQQTVAVDWIVPLPPTAEARAVLGGYAIAAGVLLGLLVAAFAKRAYVLVAILCVLPSAVISVALELYPEGSLPPDAISPVWSLAAIIGSAVGASVAWGYKASRHLTTRWSGP